MDMPRVPATQASIPRDRAHDSPAARLRGRRLGKCAIMPRMKNTSAFSRVLIVTLIVLVIAVVVEQVAMSSADARLQSAQDELSQTQTQTQQIQQENNDLNSRHSEQLLQWRNAQGRLSFLGDGSGKVCYLTFDDGPDDELTTKNLEILKEKGAVATWFCLGNDEEYTYLNLDLCKEIEAQGSAVGIHDWDQNDSYSYYKNGVDNYFTSDFDKTKEKLEAAVGHEIKICRFAGGSTTIGYYNKSVATALPQEVIKRGYQYFDWNVLAGDSESSQMVNGKVPTATILDNVMKDAEKFAKLNSPICVLMHDNPGKQTTTEALPEMIDRLKELGYTFKTLDYDTPGFYQMKISD